MNSMGLIWKSLPSECDVFCKCVWRRLDVGASAAATSWFVPFCLLHISTCLLPCSPAPLCLVPSRLNLNQPPPYPPPLPGMASILMSAVGLGVHFTSAPLPQQQQQHPPPQHQQPAPFSLPPPPPLLPPASRPIKPHSSSSTSTSSSVRRAKRQHRRGSYHTISPQIYLFFFFFSSHQHHRRPVICFSSSSTTRLRNIKSCIDSLSRKCTDYLCWLWFNYHRLFCCFPLQCHSGSSTPAPH